MSDVVVPNRVANLRGANDLVSMTVYESYEAVFDNAIELLIVNRFSIVHEDPYRLVTDHTAKRPLRGAPHAAFWISKRANRETVERTAQQLCVQWAAAFSAGITTMLGSWLTCERDYVRG